MSARERVGGNSERDVGMRAAFAPVSASNGGSQGRAGGIWRHDFVDNPDLNGLLHTTGDELVLGG